MAMKDVLPDRRLALSPFRALQRQNPDSTEAKVIPFPQTAAEQKPSNLDLFVADARQTLMRERMMQRPQPSAVANTCESVVCLAFQLADQTSDLLERSPLRASVETAQAVLEIPVALVSLAALPVRCKVEQAGMKESLDGVKRKIGSTVFGSTYPEY